MFIYHLEEVQSSKGKLVIYRDRNLIWTGLLLFAGKVDPTPHTSSFNMGYLVSPYPYPNGTAGPIPVSMVSTMMMQQSGSSHVTSCLSFFGPLDGHDVVNSRPAYEIQQCLAVAWILTQAAGSPLH
jgi:hypothetical protein